MATNSLEESVGSEPVEVEFESSSYSCNLLSSHMKLRCDGYFCDIIIKSGDFEVKAHRNILASATEYFKGMFLNETKEAESGIVDFSSIPPMVVKQCIDFIYSGKVSISMATIRCLLDTAVMMQLSELCELCVKFLAQNINVESCAEIMTLSRLYCKDSLNLPMKTFLLDNFQTFSTSEDFLAFDVQYVEHCIDLVRDNTPAKEKLIWDSINRWVEHDLEERSVNFVTLFKNVDLSCFTKAFIRENMLSNSMVNDSNFCLKKITISATEHPLTPANNDECGPNVILYYSESSKAIVQFCAKSKKRSAIARCPITITDFTNIISHKGRIFVGDGITLYKFYEGKWSKSDQHDNEQQTSQLFNKCVGVGNTVFMVTHYRIYEYDIQDLTFTCHELNAALIDRFIITASPYKIYIFSCKNMAFEFDLKIKVLTRLCDIPYGHNLGVAVWYDSKVFLFCNTPGTYITYRILWCDPAMDIWGSVDGFKMSTQPMAVHISDKIYLYGGYDLQEVDLDKLKVQSMIFSPMRCTFATS